MNAAYSTRQAAKALGLRADRLQRAVWLGEVDAPQKVGHAYVWTLSDIERAAWQLGRYQQFEAWQQNQKGPVA